MAGDAWDTTAGDPRPARDGRWCRDPPGRGPRSANRRAARPHGAKRGWQVDPGQGAARLPGVRGHKGPGRLQGGGHHLLADRDQGEGGHLPRLPVPRGDPRGAPRPVPPPGPFSEERHRPLRARTARGGDGVDAQAGHGRLLRGPLPERGLLRRGEEAQRDPPDGRLSPTWRCSTRRTRPGHRRPQGRRRRGRPGRAARPRSGCW